MGDLGIDTSPQVSIPGVSTKGVSIPSLRYRYLGAFQGVPIPSLAGTDTQIPVLELGTDTTDRVEDTALSGSPRPSHEHGSLGVSEAELRLSQ
ncbi:hypothetical protein V6N11_044163 [Hibiscus sabdariffa]|uniref:Uncharacterized protein n=1 Tax=Hibiscus sabdariffa TaxID=183260 RepID=A0ABR2REF5_9ROSI